MRTRPLEQLHGEGLVRLAFVDSQPFLYSNAAFSVPALL